MQRTAAAFTDAPDGAWGILLAHAPDQEAIGNYSHIRDASAQAAAIAAAQPGSLSLLVRRHRDEPSTGNGYRPLTRQAYAYLYGIDHG
jgi:hypothetical protein